MRVKYLCFYSSISHIATFLQIEMYYFQPSLTHKALLQTYSFIPRAGEEGGGKAKRLKPSKIVTGRKWQLTKIKVKLNCWLSVKIQVKSFWAYIYRIMRNQKICLHILIFFSLLFKIAEIFGLWYYVFPEHRTHTANDRRIRSKHVVFYFDSPVFLWIKLLHIRTQKLWRMI